ncbi:hypothetical protein EV426DRAFT_704755 [Tirmania nivea]|nr:hypothetical protein EV426DRAFT_704755 [Tirmania nivea]
MAAATSPGWLDSLSEEWVSEPRDPNSSPLSNKTGESVQVHGPLTTDANASRPEQNHGQASPADELPSTMRVTKEETPDWKWKIMDDITKGQSGPVKDLFSPMGLENIFRPPPASPTRLQHIQLPPPGEPRHQFAGAKGSMIPLPTSVIVATPPQAPSPPNVSTPKASSPIPQTKTSQISTPRRALSEAPGTSNTPTTSIYLHDQGPASQYAGDSIEVSSGFKPAATSTLREVKMSAPFKLLEQNQIRLGKRKAYTLGDAPSDSECGTEGGLKENLKPKAQSSPEGGRRYSKGVQDEEPGLEFHHDGGGDINDLLGQVESTQAIISQTGPASWASSHTTSEYPSSPPWLTRSPQHFEHSLAVIVSSSPMQEGQGEESSDDEEGILPPNELNAELAQSRERQKTLEPRSLPEPPAPYLSPAGKQRTLPQPISSPDDPIAAHSLAHPRVSNPSRTPSPKKYDPPGPGPSNGSPLKLFAGTYDTFTKERLVRRISQLEGKSISSTDESKAMSEPNSDQLYGSNPEISVIEPPGTPLIYERPFHVAEDSQICLRRPRQRAGSSSSLPNDGIHGPKSPLKERTPKRIRRSWSGNRPSSLLTQEQKWGADDDGQRSLEEISIKSPHYRRSSAPSPSPRPRGSLSSTNSAAGSGSSLRNRNDSRESTKQEIIQSPLNSGGSIVFGGSGEGSLMGMEFLGLEISRDSNNKNRKGSVTTQDFLAQAEEVMLRIRAMTAANGEQTWFSEGTTGLESFLSGGELSLSAEEFSLVREKLLNLSIIAAQKHGAPPQHPSAMQTRPGISTLVNAPEQQKHASEHENNDGGGVGSYYGTTRRYHTNSSSQQDVIDALCAAVISDRHKIELKNVTLRSKTTSAPQHADKHGSPRKSRVASAESNSSRSDIHSIHPTQIEHLIPVSIGSMAFDPVQKAWVKSRAQRQNSLSPPPRKEISAGSVNSLGSKNGRGRQVADETDEDVFHGISDLSVDEEMEARVLIEASRMQQMISELEEYVIADSDHEAEYEYTSTKVVRRIEREEVRREIREKRVVGDQEDVEDVTGEFQEWDQTYFEGDSSENVTVEQQEESSWVDENTEDDNTILHRQCAESSGGSVSNHSASTGSRTETRSTSWGDSVGERNGEHSKMEDALNQLSLMESSQMGGAYGREPVELEQPIEEDEDDGYGQRQRSSGNRAVDYSSPSVSTLSRQARNAKARKRVDWVQGENDMTLDQNSFQSSSMSQGSSKSLRILSSRNTSLNKRLSSGGRSFLGRPVSRINEEDEEGAEKEDGESVTDQRGVSNALTPASVKGKRPFDSKAVPPPATMQRPNVSYHFSSPLPELSYQFEATRELLNLELSYVAQRHADVGKGKQPSMKSIEYSFSVAQDNLVRHLTDVEPFEPYWEYMKFLKLNDRKILTIHGLHEWCPRIEELDVSTNEIGQVSGVPNTVRNLKISCNRLSSLTAWGHLTNLQYLDISMNNLDSLAGLRHMFHLRELRADDNQITGLEEIFHLDALCSLSIKRNKIKCVNFEKASLSRLTDLDFKGNGMEGILRLDKLPSLSTLCLDGNLLSTLQIPLGRKLENFRVLRLSANKFKNFDVTPFPNLRTLYLDDNSLGRVHGLRKAKHLDGLSIREQCTVGDRVRNDALPFEEMFEIRKIYASGNAICTLNLDLDFLNLQYLELAGVQLTSLQANFGHLVSNVRVLNLNYNAISDLRPLFGIIRLKKLLLVGNRIRSMRKIAAVLECFPSLSFLDLRANPLTLGFYPPALELSNHGASCDDPLLVEPFTLAPLDECKDRIFQSRLDMETALLRRRYEIVISERCPRMKNLDGLLFRREEVFRKDVVYDELKRVGLIRHTLEPEPKSSTDERIHEEKAPDKAPDKAPILE